VSRGSYCHQDLTKDPDIAGFLQQRAPKFRPAMTRLCDLSLPVPDPPWAVDGGLLDAEATRIVYTPMGGVPTELRRSLDDCSTGDWTLAVVEPNLAAFAPRLCPGMCDAWTARGGGGCVDVITSWQADSGTPTQCGFVSSM
jgi:hypothetical protein